MAFPSEETRGMHFHGEIAPLLRPRYVPSGRFLGFGYQVVVPTEENVVGPVCIKVMFGFKFFSEVPITSK